MGLEALRDFLKYSIRPFGRTGGRDTPLHAVVGPLLITAALQAFGRMGALIAVVVYIAVVRAMTPGMPLQSGDDPASVQPPSVIPVEPERTHLESALQPLPRKEELLERGALSAPMLPRPFFLGTADTVKALHLDGQDGVLGVETTNVDEAVTALVRVLGETPAPLPAEASDDREAYRKVWIDYQRRRALEVAA